ncbi:helix-turn-helix transcriptional regulator [Aggregatimonas sangjinii]|uniref:Helix-turn-helix transcriptional regulator n=1 Tax=Aggregatimonas sangjinii TaxID=2583587 RepID=A0A5B7SX74_9FLAO|nr:helix-turn-helix transcriptional regulator [Aggregatimonas sangjinii]QCX01581.1 helix-turn-helix transcriptional regulator [Aggregatimonas sangjinii]
MIKNYAKELNYPIPENLKQFVIASIYGESDTKINVKFPVHPIGFPLLVSIFNDIPLVYVRGEKTPRNKRLTINGQISNADIEVEIDGVFGQIGFVLHPTATYYLFHRTGTFFSNKCQNFDAVTPIAFPEIFKELERCSSPEDRLPILLELIRELAKNRLPPIPWLDDSLEEIFSKNGKVSQTMLAENSGVGVRHYRRKFKEIIGVSPKYFCKVIQLNTIFELLKTSNTAEIHRLALDCGYYDQAHFVNEFRQMIGESPTHFLKGKHAYVASYLGRKA